MHVLSKFMCWPWSSSGGVAWLPHFIGCLKTRFPNKRARDTRPQRSHVCFTVSALYLLRWYMVLFILSITLPIVLRPASNFGTHVACVPTASLTCTTMVQPTWTYFYDDASTPHSSNRSGSSPSLLDIDPEARRSTRCHSSKLTTIPSVSL